MDKAIFLSKNRSDRIEKVLKHFNTKFYKKNEILFFLNYKSEVIGS